MSEIVIHNFVTICVVVFLLCVAAAALCKVEYIVFKKNWWLPRLLMRICRVPEEDIWK